VSSFKHTADYTYIDVALKARWEPFCALVQEVEQFVARPKEDFAEYRISELARLKTLNPSSSDEDLLRLIDAQITAQANPNVQFSLKFSHRIMAEYVTVAFLAHALAEAMINAVLAIGLAKNAAPEVFSLLERADIKEKWCFGPKAFHPTYELPKGGALFQTLQQLTRERNAFVHYKIELEMDGVRTLEGSRVHRATWGSQITWLKRFFSLPYDLAAHTGKMLPDHLLMMLCDSRPIERFSAHVAKHTNSDASLPYTV
jgi:hypothetical protein